MTVSDPHLSQRSLVEVLGDVSLRFVSGPNAETLAVVRMVTCITAVATVRAIVGRPYELLDEALILPPVGTAWIWDVVGVTRWTIDLAALITLLGIALLFVGFARRLSGTLAVVGFLYVGWLPSLTGKVDHHHHVLWFLVLVTLFPSTDRWSFDSWLMTRRGGPPRRAEPRIYAIAIGSGIVLIGLIYLFPGLAKLGASPEWVFSDNLVNIASRLATEKGRELSPIFEIPLVPQAMALGTIAFEVLFLPLSLVPSAQRWIRWVGIVFHQATAFLLGITFWTLIALYVVFFDWKAIGERVGFRTQRSEESTVRPARYRFAAFGAVLMVSVAAVVSVLDVTSWPFSVYPQFSIVEDGFVSQVEFVYEDGRREFAADTAVAEAFSAGAVKPLAIGVMVRSQSGTGPERSYLRLLDRLGVPPIEEIRFVTYEWREPSNVDSVVRIYPAVTAG